MMEESAKILGGIKFSVWSPTEVRKFSVAEVTAPETYDEDGMPVQGGLMDNRLGTLEPGQKCATCGNTSAKCPGHFGHIELAEPVLHIAFVDDVHKLLLTTCRSCNRIKLDPEELAHYKAIRESKAPYAVITLENIRDEIIEKAKKVKSCPHCGKEQYDLIFTKPTIFVERTEAGENRLLPITIRERLSHVPDEDLMLLGYDPTTARPEWFVLQVLPVPPVTVRPSIILETGIRSEDDLTHKLVDIIRVNQRLKESKEAGTPPLIVQDLVDLLQYHVTTYFDNEVSGIPQAHHRSGRPLKTLTQRLKGKEGRFRGSLSGKRVDFSSRTVISPDPNLTISNVGVPTDVAKKLTIPETVSQWNLEKLKALVTNGPNTYPGANYIIRPDGVKIRLDYVTDRKTIADSLAPGYIVERHLSDGDIVIFNRQPSLHRMSIMAHSVVVLPYRTFRLHPAVCPPYNADFDGDEMNLHVPQSEEARAEATLLMRVQDQLISPRYGGPIIGGIRDFITGAFMLTRDETVLTRDEFANLALVGGYRGPLPEPAVATKDGQKLYSGRQLFSLFLPKDFNFVITSKWNKAAKGEGRDVVIKNGQLISGVIDKASIGAEEPDSVLHRIAKDYGTDVARKFLDSILIMLKTYITHRGFTYGYSDLWLSPETRQEISDIIQKTYDKVHELIQQYRDGSLPLTRGLSAEEALELYVVNELSRARDRAGRTADRAFPDNNSGIIMASTGARGSTLNIGQMTAALGQQSIRGKRIQKGYRNRALPHYIPNETSPDARGFVKSNYRDGLSPLEFFFHAMGGREGLVDTAVRTQQSGYMQRRLINALEHLKIEYDQTVRDPHGNIVQYLYGEDGIDPAKSDHGEAVNISRLIEAEAIVDEGRKATEEAIKKIIEEHGASLNPRMRASLEKALLENKLSREGVEKVMRKVVDLVDRALAEPGEAIGVVTAQSIGEPGTQMTLRTFHFAGVKERNVTLGLPRLIELVDARKKPVTPTMDIYLDEAHRGSREKALEVAREILFTQVGDLIEKSETDYSGVLTFYFSEAKLAERGCTLEEANAVLEGTKKKYEVKMNEGKRSIKVTVPDEPDAQTLLTLKNKLLNTRVKGVPDIERVTIVKQDEEWVIQTAGSNLAKVVLVDGVDTSRIATNNVYEIWQTLGIEAARTALVKEITNTLEEQGLEVDVRHIMLVADLMTSKGYLQQIGRHGIAGTKTSVLARAAFEITVPTIARASLEGQVETLRGVTENVIVGATVPVGTGMVDLYMKVKEGKEE
ncbi:DNA-directed RNA polymerase, subunit A''/DNA-directed RNA polymerase subunit A' [Candidatus Nitrososphaera evergladensis SR1]|uniref:Multifunctional fusion protein n=1 Tax=Candidatus Nitrososphaera evergladensis SR1 TaxID=1459636 RepID=A0A075MTA3_9ARCH|nr:DNA-directed RNA polymerase, subunit A''/DNA-directed RNA polymerase subunit A' [Candidatus Nitrososphaera evergladensis SR1]